jgi:hypothetical protein
MYGFYRALCDLEALYYARDLILIYANQHWAELADPKSKYPSAGEEISDRNIFWKNQPWKNRHRFTTQTLEAKKIKSLKTKQKNVIVISKARRFK